ncbi:MAG: hypothetical protein EPN21_11685 [Methylococcaceae bacterium]|nr:MAG: hypothetical protein EPN21_11685 [Methylococcaceae bacterium]
MNIKRLLKHLMMPAWLAHRAFRRTDLDAIEAAVRASEHRHCGELRVVIEGPLDLAEVWRNRPVRQRAVAHFAHQHIWDTEDNSGILLYIQLVDRRVEIVADRGISAKVAQAQWDAICRAMENAFRRQAYRQGVLEAIELATALLARHFPATADNPDELPNRPLRV